MSTGERSEESTRLKGKLLKAYKRAYRKQMKPDNKRLPEFKKSFISDDLHPGASVRPAIPVVGKDYPSAGDELPRVLVYASAENLTWWEKKPKRKSLKWDRGYTNDPRQEFFRNVFIEPISNGGLLTVARYLLQKIANEPLDDPLFRGAQFSDDPRVFVEQIAVANYSKFTLKPEGGTNLDPTKQRIHSELYVKEDLSILSPDILILPHTIYWSSIHKKSAEDKFFGEESEGSRPWRPRIIIGCPQVQGRNHGWIGKQACGKLRKMNEVKNAAWKEEWIKKCEQGSLIRAYLQWIDRWRSIPEFDIRSKGSVMIENTRVDRKTNCFCSPRSAGGTAT